MASDKLAPPIPTLLTDTVSGAFLRLAIGVLLVGGLVAVLLVWWIDPEQAVRAIGGVLVGAVALASAMLLGRGHVIAAIGTLIVGLWFTVSVIAFLGGGLRAPAVIGYPALIALGGWLLGPPTAAVLTGLTLLYGAALLGAEHLGWLPAIAPAPAVLLWTVDAIVITSTGALTIYATRNYHALYASQSRLAESMANKADALAAGEARLRLVTENVPALISYFDSQHVCRYANWRYADFFGFTQEEIVGKPLAEVAGEEVFRSILPHLERALAGEAVRYSGTRRSPLLGERHIESSLVPNREEGGVAGYFVMILDVTERQQAEEAVRLSEMKFAKVFRSRPVPISLARSDDGRFVDVNPAFEALFGWPRDEIVGRTSTEIGLWLSREDRLRWREALSSSGATRSFEVDWRSKAGEQRLCQISAEVVRIDSEDYILALTFDITERKRIEAELQAGQARLAEAQRIGRFGSWELDLQTQMFIWSEEITRIFEATAPPGTVSYAAFLRTIHPEDREPFDKAFRAATAAGKSIEYTYRLRMRDGRIKYVHVRAEAQLDANGRPLKSIGTTQDITEQELARQEIRRLNADLEQRVAERTAELTSANRELESFAYSISHDLRAPLRGIDGFSHLLAEEYGERLDDQGRGYLERVRRAAQRMGNLIDDILELSRVTRQEMRRVRVDLSQIAAELLEERARSEPEHRVGLSIAPGCTAFGDPQLLRVMLQNLLENAWKYSAKTASPRIEFGCETEEGTTVFFVRDNGVGFDMRYADRLFTPFQRLHKPEEFEGTGIGLATVARVVHRHGGRVKALSEPGKGATFSFTLATESAGHQLV